MYMTHPYLGHPTPAMPTSPAAPGAWVSISATAPTRCPSATTPATARSGSSSATAPRLTSTQRARRRSRGRCTSASSCKQSCAATSTLLYFGPFLMVFQPYAVATTPHALCGVILYLVTMLVRCRLMLIDACNLMVWQTSPRHQFEADLRGPPRPERVRSPCLDAERDLAHRGMGVARVRPAPGVHARAGTATSALFWTISHAGFKSTPPHTRRVASSTSCPCLSGVDR